MGKIRRRGVEYILFSLMFLVGQYALGQAKQPDTRRPAATAESSPASAPAPTYQYYSILDGMPILLELHHDTEVGTGRSIDVYMFVIEMQVMNSDGNLEPIGLQISNFYTAKPLDPANDIYTHAARDCSLWNKVVVRQMQQRKSGSKTWPYVEFLTAQGARVIQTNEDGNVYWSDDVECWGSSDRFPPF